MSPSTNAWLKRVALSLLIGLVCGGLAYAIARGIGGMQTLISSQQLAGDITGGLRDGLESLAGNDLRERRRAIQAADAANAQWSLALGFGIAAVSAAGSYVWLERRATA